MIACKMLILDSIHDERWTYLYKENRHGKKTGRRPSSDDYPLCLAYRAHVFGPHWMHYGVIPATRTNQIISLNKSFMNELNDIFVNIKMTRCFIILEN